MRKSFINSCTHRFLQHAGGLDFFPFIILHNSLADVFTTTKQSTSWRVNKNGKWSIMMNHKAKGIYRVEIGTRLDENIFFYIQSVNRNLIKIQKICHQQTQTLNSTTKHEVKKKSPSYSITPIKNIIFLIFILSSLSISSIS